MKLKLDPRSKLHNARRVLSLIGIEVKANSVAQAAALEQLRQLEELGPQETQHLIEVFQSMNAFDQLVSDNLKEMNVGERHSEIAENFESIIKDLERKIRNASGGSNVGRKWVDKIQEKLITKFRGSMTERFEKINVASEAVFADSDQQIKHERAILDAYADYREALRDSMYIAEDLKNKATAARDEAGERLRKAKENLEAVPSDASVMQQAPAQIAMDEAQREFEKMDRRQDLAASLHEKLTISYTVSEAVMTRYAETTKVRENVQNQASIFYTTNKGVMNVMKATIVQLEGTLESAETLNVMKQKGADMLKKITDNGSAMSRVTQRATEIAYEASISPEQLRDLYKKTVEFKLEQAQTGIKMRKKREENLKAVQVELKKGQEALAAVNVQIVEAHVGANNGSSRPAEKLQAIELDVPEMNASRLKKNDGAEKAPTRKRTASTP